MPKATFHFPPDFIWGVATSSHQVEGGNDNNQWWDWEQEPGRIKEEGRSGKACDWWQRAEEDFDRAAALGLKGLRLSIEWSRVEPEPGKFDDAALERYRTMLEALRARGLEPMVTLHHFTNPRWLERQGAWLNEGTVAYFARYVERVVQALGAQTTLWCTINEPNVYATRGYLLGDFPPGERDLQQTKLVLRHLLEGHAAAYHAIHRLQPTARVGLAHNFLVVDPANPRSFLDRQVAALSDWAYNGLLLTALHKGWLLPPLGFAYLPQMRNTLDWIGLNYYTRIHVAFDRGAKRMLYARLVTDEKAEMMDGGYGELYPRGLYRALKRLKRLGLPLYITENGLPDADDDMRPRALLLHLRQLWWALQENMPIRGYYHWTLVDNFEWTDGWTLRFGLFELDVESQARRRRPSADLYAAIAQGNAITPDLIEAYAPEVREQLLPDAGGLPQEEASL